jgi:NAD(P)-dependent dehydrogenase (short-subunit alcohol dehydrogenase family)
MRHFENKIAVVTGAANGIGFAIAKKAAQLGMRVILADLDAKTLFAAEQLLKTQDYNVKAYVTDVSQEKEMAALAEQTIAHYGIPQLLVNNAGIGGPIGPIWEVPFDQLQLTWNINVFGIVHGLRAFMPWLLQSNEPAHIVNTASMAGFYSAPYLVSYEMSKHAAVALTEALYHDLQLIASHIKVSLLCPGWVTTNILNTTSDTLGVQPQEGNFSEVDMNWLLKFARSVKKGISTEQVANEVFAAIEQEKFYIFTDKKMKEHIIAKRLESILAEKNPVAFEF